MSDWILLSDMKDPPRGDAAALLESGLLVLELAQGPDRSLVLLDHQAETPWARTLSLFADPEAGLVLLHRQGGRVLRHVLPGPLPRSEGVVRLSFRFDAPARGWVMHYDAAGQTLKAGGREVQPFLVADLVALASPHSGAVRHPSVLWFGLTQGASPPGRAPWVGLRTPIATPKGAVAAGLLKPGDLVLTRDEGPQPLLAVRPMNLPSRGSFAPVLLARPYYSGSDLLVSSDQLVVLSGPEVEYLFAEEEVLIAAGHLIDGRTALAETRRAMTSCVALDLGRPQLLRAGGCHLLSASAARLPAPLRVVEPFEVQPLMALLSRTLRPLVA